MKNIENILQGLNEKQAEAVSAPFKPTDVIAGAGAGKTTVLTRRAAYFIEQGIRPENIVAITFTNKAADEMKERIAKLLGPDVAKRMHVSTFHSLGNIILRKIITSYDPRYTEKYTILDDDDRKAILKDTLKEMDIDIKMYPPVAFGSWIEKQKSNLNPPERSVREPGDMPRVLDVYVEYEKKLIQQNLVDFDDLIFKTVIALRRNETAAKALQEQVKALLIDEYQDTNHSQHAFARIMAKKHRNIFVVGDPDQSIYGFRFADIHVLLDFKKDYPDANEIKLEQNYRSTDTILNATNELIQNNRERIEKTLWTEREEETPVRIYTIEGRNEEYEANLIANTILMEKRKFNYRWKDFAVLYRANALSKPIEAEFIRRNIPHIVYGSIAFLSRAEIKDVLAYLRVTQNPRDFVSLKRIINVPARGIGPKAQNQIIQELKKCEGGLLGDISEIAKALPKKQAEGLLELRQALLDFKEQAYTNPLLSVAISDFLKNIGYLEMYEEKAKESAIYETKLDNITELMMLSQTYTPNKPSLQGFLEHIALASDADKKDEDKVSLMTCHRAKGLEFPSVFVAGLEEGIIPHAAGSEEEVEEERRVAYVAMTRAKDRLHLSYARKRTIYGRELKQTSSRFIDEIPPEFLEGRF